MSNETATVETLESVENLDPKAEPSDQAMFAAVREGREDHDRTINRAKYLASARKAGKAAARADFDRSVKDRLRAIGAL